MLIPPRSPHVLPSSAPTATLIHHSLNIAPRQYHHITLMPPAITAHRKVRPELPTQLIMDRSNGRIR